MKTIGILAPDTNNNHLSYYQAIVDTYSSFHIMVFTNTWIKENLVIAENLQIHFILKYENETFSKYFKRIQSEIKKLDLLICEELYSAFVPFLLQICPSKVKKLFSLHNVNKWLIPPCYFGLKYLYYNILRKLVISNSDGFIVISPNVKKYIIDAGLTQKPVFFIPFNNLGKVDYKKNQDCQNLLSITIPGSINSLRRDYLLVLNVFEEVLKEGIHNLELVLLGKIVNSNDSDLIREKCNYINNAYGQKVRYWEAYVSPEEYDFYLKETDFLMSNNNPIYRHNDYLEIYGLSKETGIGYLMLKYMKPCIMAISNIPMLCTNRQTLTYSSKDELSDLFVQISKGIITAEQFHKAIIEGHTSFMQLINSEKTALINYT
ncbi:MAG: hypothetical protein JXB49_23000 [Bacteroidales bacterium]|nr:hypothetical protein [Bacteroidales bacterium]